MTANEKIIRLAEITTGTDIEAGRLATFLALIGKLDATDAAKVICDAIGTNNALRGEKKVLSVMGEVKIKMFVS